MEALSRRVDGEIRFLGVGGARMERLGIRSLFPMKDINHVGGTAIVANLPRILSRMRRGGARGGRGGPGCPGHHRLPRLQPRRGAAGAQEAAVDPDRRLRLADGLGVAPAAGAADGGLRRSPPGDPAVRARGASAAEGPAMHLCRPPAHREIRSPASRAGRAPADRRGGSPTSWSCPEAGTAS